MTTRRGRTGYGEERMAQADPDQFHLHTYCETPDEAEKTSVIGVHSSLLGVDSTLLL